MGQSPVSGTGEEYPLAPDQLRVGESVHGAATALGKGVGEVCPQGGSGWSDRPEPRQREARPNGCVLESPATSPEIDFRWKRELIRPSLVFSSPAKWFRKPVLTIVLCSDRSVVADLSVFLVLNVVIIVHIRGQSWDLGEVLPRSHRKDRRFLEGPSLEFL
jgi:hypothetical protein